MFTIARASTLCAFSIAVLFSNCLLVQYAPAELIEITGFQPTAESQEDTADGDQTVHPPQQEWTLDPNPIEIYSPVEAFDDPHSEFMAEFDTSQHTTLFQESINPDFTAQASDLSGNSDLPNAIFLKDVGYTGPGDMRTHLWRDHSSDLEGNGISHETLMSMPLESVQKWHNYFHGTESAPASP